MYHDYAILGHISSICPRNSWFCHIRAETAEVQCQVLVGRSLTLSFQFRALKTLREVLGVPGDFQDKFFHGASPGVRHDR
jgi:hypothetical protein